MSLKIKRGEYADLDGSKLFGDVLMPEDWFENNVFGEDEVFLCQIKLEDIAEYDVARILPHEGTLYFFLDFSASLTKGIVRYSAANADAYTNFNDGVEDEYGLDDEIPLSFAAGNEGSCMLCRDEKTLENEVCLLRLFPKELGMEFLSEEGGGLYFTVDKEDLKRLDFSNVKAFIVQPAN